MLVEEEVLARVRHALEKPEYDWRTLRGVAQEVNLPMEKVREAITALGTDAIQSEIPSTTGELLFTTKQRFQENRPTEEEMRKVLSAFNNQEHKWRTVRGVSVETGLSAPKVVAVIAGNRDKLLQSDIPSTQGEELYTTRDRYLQSAGPVAKMMGFFVNRLV